MAEQIPYADEIRRLAKQEQERLDTRYHDITYASSIMKGKRCVYVGRRYEIDHCQSIVPGGGPTEPHLICRGYYVRDDGAVLKGHDGHIVLVFPKTELT